MSYSRFLTKCSLLRQPSAIREITAIKAQSGPEMISLAAGAPNSELFPFTKIEIEIYGQKKVTFQGAELSHALQYSPTPGVGMFLDNLQTLQSEFHSFDHNKHKICVTTGSQDGLGKILEATLNKGDKVLVDSPIYSGTLAALRPLGVDLVGVKTDSDGMDIDDLERCLQEEGSGSRILVTVTNGSNPSGGSLSLERRKKLLELAWKYDLLIIEDDPYYWLTFEQPVPSLFKLDNDVKENREFPAGRVVRTDSLSKTVSSGIRIGWLTGPSELIDRVILHQQASVMHPPTLTQVLVSKLFSHWNGNQGFVEHCRQVQDFYRLQCDKTIESCEKHLKDIARWEKPKAGMFLWLECLKVKNTKQIIESKARANNVLLVPGQCFMPDDTISNFCRISYSQESPERIDMAIERLAKLLKEAEN